MASTAIMNVMLSWLKGVASWILELFNLAGNTGFSPIAWLSDNWIWLVIAFMAIGVTGDILVWLLRWRPYWVWFGKKHIVIDDDDFFQGEELVDSGLYDPALFHEPARRRSRRTIAPPRRKPALVERVDKNAERRRRLSKNDDLFVVNRNDEKPNQGEDEVFNVSNLPVSRDEIKFRHKRKSDKRN